MVDGKVLGHLRDKSIIIAYKIWLPYHSILNFPEAEQGSLGRRWCDNIFYYGTWCPIPPCKIWDKKINFVYGEKKDKLYDRVEWTKWYNLGVIWTKL